MTDYVHQMLTGERTRYGFVLLGGNDDPQGHDLKSCLSRLDKIQLVVSYTVD